MATNLFIVDIDNHRHCYSTSRCLGGKSLAGKAIRLTPSITSQARKVIRN